MPSATVAYFRRAFTASLFAEIREGFDGEVAPKRGEGLSGVAVEDGVEVEQVDGDFADVGEGEDEGFVVVKMTAPSLPPWVEEGYESAGGFEQGADVAAFGDIAAEAGEGEVFLRRLPAVLATDDVVYVVGMVGVVLME